MEVEGHAKAGAGRRKKCVWATAAALIAILLLFLILGLTVLKPKRPVTTVNSVSLSDLDVSLRGLSLSLNVSLAIGLSIRNPNKVGFDFHNSSALLDYRGDEVGEAPIPAGQISAGETLLLNLTLTVLADRFLSNSQAFSDVLAGALPLSAHTSVSGTVPILGFIHLHVVSHTSCKFTVSIGSRNISDDGCTYKTKL